MTTTLTTPTTQAKEKRKHPRFPLAISMDIRAPGHAQARAKGVITDFSRGGLTLRTDAALEEGMSVCLNLGLPLQIRGEVRHIRGASEGGMHRYGLRLHKIEG